MQHESAFVTAFVAPARRARYLTLLETRRGRAKLRACLAHDLDLDARFARRLAHHTPAAILQLLRQEGAPELCHALSESNVLDGQDLQLGAALEQVVGQGCGTVLSCLPGQLAYYEAEDPGARYLLIRRKPA